MLQTRNGKRTAMAALKFSVDMVEGKADRLEDGDPAQSRRPAQPAARADVRHGRSRQGRRPIATGLPAGPGAASGKVYLNAERAVVAEDKGEKVLLVRIETSPEDLRGMIAAEGILTARGGVSSHAALVARQMGKVCVCGAAALDIDYQARTVTVDGKTFKEGDWISIDGTIGKVYAGQMKTAPSEIVAGLIHGDAAAQKTEKFKNFQQLMKWARTRRRMNVRTNADHAGAGRQRHRVRRRRHRPVPHRAHVLRGRPHRRDARDDPRRDRRGSQSGARQAAAVPARGFRRHLPRAQGLPGDDSLARSAAARIPAAHQGAAGGAGARRSACRRRASTSASRSCTSSTRCSVSAAAASASGIPKSRRCRPARSSKRRRSCRRKASRCSRRS